MIAFLLYSDAKALETTTRNMRQSIRTPITWPSNYKKGHTQIEVFRHLVRAKLARSSRNTRNFWIVAKCKFNFTAWPSSSGAKLINFTVYNPLVLDQCSLCPTQSKICNIARSLYKYCRMDNRLLDRMKQKVTKTFESHSVQCPKKHWPASRFNSFRNDTFANEKLKTDAE